MEQTIKSKVLDHLQKHDYITPLEALGVYRCFRLAVIVKQLRNEGHDIRTELRQDATGKRYARYWLKKG